LNAEQKVLLSYIGQNVKDNSEIPSSSLISELQGCTEKAGAKIKEVKHPLHAFNSKYFEDGEKDHFTFFGAKKARTPQKGRKNISIPEEIPLYALENFLKDPFKHHYNQILNIYYETPELLPDWEIFELNKLHEWNVKDKIKKAKLKNEDHNPEGIREGMLLQSEIPLKNYGRSELSEIEENVTTLWGKVEEVKKGWSIGVLQDNLTFNLKGGHKINLKIELDAIGEDALFLIVSKKDKFKYELSAYLRALVLKAMGGTGKLHYFCFDEDIPHYQEIQVEIDANQALEKAKNFLELFNENHNRIIPFYPELDLNLKDLKECEDKPDLEKTEIISELIDKRFESFESFFPSEYFLREFQQGFFNGTSGDARLLELQKITIEITEEVHMAFNK
jgi:exodeoxyribonuclease V gamma subunit